MKKLSWRKIGMLFAGFSMAVGVATGVASFSDVVEVKGELSSLFTITSGEVVSNSGYAKYEATVEERGWIITFGGNNKSLGTNSGNRSKCNLANYSQYAVSPVTTSDVATAFVSTTSISNVSKISYTLGGGSNQSDTNIFLIYSNNGSSFQQMELNSGSQGGTIGSDGSYTFSKCSGYFGLLLKATNSSGNWRLDDLNITFYGESSGTTTQNYTVKFASNGGTGSMEDVETDITKAYEIPECEFTAPNGKTFDYWLGSDNEEYDPGESIDANTFAKDAELTLTAQWKAIPSKPEVIDGLIELPLSKESDGVSASDAKVSLSGTERNAIKLGTSSAGGSFSVSVPSNAIRLVVYAAAWKGNETTLTISESYCTNNSATINADEGVANNSPFTLTLGSDLWDECYFNEFILKDLNTSENSTILISTAKRGVIWYVGYETASTKVPTSITVTFNDPSNDYAVGASIRTYTVMANYDDGTDSKNVTNQSTLTGFDTTTVGDSKTAQISYTVGDTTKTYDYVYNVKEDSLQSISIDEIHSSLFGFVNQNFDSTGIKVKGNWLFSEPSEITGATITFNPEKPTVRGKMDVTVTASYEGKTSEPVVFKDVEVTNPGTKDLPLSVDEAIAVYEAGKTSTAFYVEGLVTSVSGKNIFISDLEGKGNFEFYNATYDSEDIKAAEVGDYIVGYGTITYYEKGGVYEFNKSCKVSTCYNLDKVPTSISQVGATPKEYGQFDIFDYSSIKVTLEGGSDVDFTSEAEQERLILGEFTTDTVTASATATLKYDYYGHSVTLASYSYKVNEAVCTAVEILEGSKVTGFRGPKELDGDDTGSFDFSQVKVQATLNGQEKDVSGNATINCDATITTAGTYNISITATVGGITSEPVAFTVEVENNGLSKDFPLSIEQAIAKCDAGDRSSYYVIGYATDDGEWTDGTPGSGKVTLVDADGNKFKLFKYVHADSAQEAGIKKGNEVVAYGQLDKYYDDYELAQGCKVVSYGTPNYTVESFEVTTNPRLSYYLGESFSTEGMVVTGHTDIGFDFDITNDANLKVDASQFNPLVVFEKDETEASFDIVVSYEGLEQKVTLTATVSAKESNPVWKKVTDSESLSAGDMFVIGSSSKEMLMSTNQASNNRPSPQSATFSGDVVTFSEESSHQVIKLEGSDGAWKLATLDGDGKVNGYLKGVNGNNYLRTDSATATSPDTWTISINNGNALIQSKASSRYIKYNSGSTLFGTYASGQTDIQLYRYEAVTPEMIDLVVTCNLAENSLTNRTTVDVSDFTIKARYDDDSYVTLTAGVTLEGEEVTLSASQTNELTFKFTHPTDGQFEKTIELTAREYVEVTDIAINTFNNVMFEGETRDISAVVYPTGEYGKGGADNPTYTFTSSNPDILEVKQHEDGSYYIEAKEVSTDGNKVTINAIANDDESICDSMQVTVNSDDIVSIAVNTDLSTQKVEYQDKDTLDAKGLVITATYESGKTENIAYTGNESLFSFDKATLENHSLDQSDYDDTIVVTYAEKTTSYDVTVSTYSVSAEVTTVENITSIYSDSPITTSDGVTAVVNYKVNYSNGTSVTLSKEVKLTDYSVGIHNVEIKVDDDKYTLNFNYNVLEAKVNSLIVLTNPTNKENIVFYGDDYDGEGYTLNVSYNSGRKENVTCGENGFVVTDGENLQPGTTSVTATYGGMSISLPVVVETEEDVIEIFIGGDGTYNFETVLGEPYSFSGTISGNWESGIRDITEDVRAAIENGINTENLGKKTYTVEYNGKTLVLTVTVKHAVATSISIDNKLSGNVYVGDEFNMKATALPANADADILWMTSDSSIATIDANGHLVIVGTGEVTVTAYTANNLKDSFVINCVRHVSSVDIEEETLVLGDREGFTQGQLTIVVGPEDAYDKSFTITVLKDYQETNDLVVTLDGKVTAKKAGVYVVIVTTTDGAFKDACIVHVLSDAEVTSISVQDGYTNQVTLGDAYTFDGHILATFEYGTVDITDEVINQIVVPTGVAGEQRIEVAWNNKTTYVVVTVKYAASNKVILSNVSDGEHVVDDSFTVHATVAPYNANQKVTWSTSDASIATVDENGKVTVVGAGTVIITATTSDGRIASFSFVAYSHVQYVDVEESVLFLNLNNGGNQGQINVEVGPNTAKDYTFTYQVADTEGYLVKDALSVDKNGKVTAYATGTYYLLIISNENPDAYDVVMVIVESNDEATGITASGYTNVVTVGDKYVFDGKVVAVFTDSEVDITSEVIKQIVVDTSKEGIQTIEVKWNGHKTNIVIDVRYAPSKGITLNGGEKGAYAVGDTTYLVATNSENANPIIHFSSSNTNVARVDDSGKVTFIGEGSVTITATTVDGVSASTVFKVYVKVRSVEAKANETSLLTGASTNINVTVNEGASIYLTSYSSSNNAGLEVDKNGKVTAKKAGSYQVTVTVTDKLGNKKTAVVYIEVSDPVVPVIDEPVEEKGCASSLSVSSALVFIGFATATGLAFSKKRKEDK